MEEKIFFEKKFYFFVILCEFIEYKYKVIKVILDF